MRPRLTRPLESVGATAVDPLPEAATIGLEVLVRHRPFSGLLLPLLRKCRQKRLTTTFGLQAYVRPTYFCALGNDPPSCWRVLLPFFVVLPPSCCLCLHPLVGSTCPSPFLAVRCCCAHGSGNAEARGGDHHRSAAPQRQRQVPAGDIRK